MPPIFMLVGPPAVGRDTTSRALAAHFPRSLHIAVDDLRTMVVSGLALPSAQWSSELVEQIALARSTAAHMALAYRAAGFAVVIDDFWDAQHDADYHALLTADPDTVARFILYPTQAEAHARNLQRSGDSPARAYIDEGIRIVYGQIAPVLDDLQQGDWQVVDTTALSVEQTVATLLERTGST